MSPTILIAIVAVIAVAAFVLMRSRKDKATTGKKTTGKSTAKSAKANEATPAPVEKQTPKIDINDLITQLNLLITDKEFAKAEAAINLNLKKDPSLHQLYLKLADLYHAQDDDFAIKQLLDTLQKSNLNEIYQRVFNEHELFKAEQEKANALEQSQKSPEVFEFTSSTPEKVDNTSGFDSLADTASSQQDNSLEFANLTMAPPATETKAEEPALSFDLATPNADATAPTPEPTLNFDLAAPTSEAVATPESALSFDLTTPKTEVPPAQEINLDFNLAAPSTEAPATETALDFNLSAPATTEVKSAPSLDFQLDLPATEAKLESPSPALDFKLDVAAPESPSPALDFKLDVAAPESPAATPSLDLNLDTPVVPATETAFAFAPEATPATTETSTQQYADVNDPIVQSFAELATTNPIDIDIELAEQYIRLGAKTAAKTLLQNQSNLSAEQATKVDALLKKIA